MLSDFTVWNSTSDRQLFPGLMSKQKGLSVPSEEEALACNKSDESVNSSVLFSRGINAKEATVIDGVAWLESQHSGSSPRPAWAV